MSFPENKLLSAFDNGVKRIFCKYSSGKVQTGNASPGIHQHREILFVLQGKGKFPLNHKVLSVQAGDVVLIDRWVAHCVGYAPTDRNLLYLWFFLFPSRLMTLVHKVDDAGKVSFALKLFQIPSDIELIINRRWDEFSQLPEKTALEDLDGYLKEPLTLLLDELRFYLHKNNLKEDISRTNRDAVTSIQHIIEATNGRDCSLAQLEKFTGFNRFYISHLFKETHGVSIGEYINRIRIRFYESARKQGLNHKQIAFELGFSSTSSLSTWVRKNREKKK